MFENKVDHTVVECWLAVTDVPLADGRTVRSGQIGSYPYQYALDRVLLPPEERTGIPASAIAAWDYNQFVLTFEPRDSAALVLLEQARLHQGIPGDAVDWKFVLDPPDQTSGDDDWYALSRGGYIVPEAVLSEPAQVAMVRQAEAVLSSFFAALHSSGIIRQES